MSTMCLEVISHVIGTSAESCSGIAGRREGRVPETGNGEAV